MPEAVATTAKTAGKAAAPAKRDDRPVVLKVEHVAKYFRLPTEQANGLKMAFINWTRGIKGYTEQRVLRDINFEVKQGDFFGIVGRNGSGKSTLLKIISQIYKPEKGKVTVKGKLVPFIELGVGFNPELTGRQNVYLNGALLGFTREEIDAMYDDIVRFAELEDFMDQKLKNYSSGMQVRLAFSVAIKAQGDILVLDEVLAVGDEAFQRKCDDFFTRIKSDPTKTVILVTHSMDAVKKYCTNAILIKDGEIIASGDKNDVADRYTLENLKAEGINPDTVDDSKDKSGGDGKNGKDSKGSKDGGKNDKKAEEKKPEHPLGLSDLVPTLQVRPTNEPVCKIKQGFDFTVEYDYTGKRPFYVAMAVHDTTRGGVPYGDAYDLSERGHHKVRFHVPTDLFNNGNFRIVASMHEKVDDNPSHNVMVAFTNQENSCDFSIRDKEGEDNFALINKKTMAYSTYDPQMATRQPPVENE
ncbi:ABC transporter ATP-binding protein [Bifidobacterium vespertilionis]|uniref:ABC transporter ATP-binding protein n=1 Tax=Bifidobacterium vespertilionis TaxID=2562524 RepID=A0A5J5E359_9BIFI|nr:ABC transporter ATP-binding protein [Bifidobacterium vespertilionis]KAA8821163.1 ABC transporter ATP-binding protein [Bifidobacterium vespertilionis]KAA8823606.1 ABC transporter ATP-binding protein [Bifidobacterium vespertilionis]